MTTVDNTAATQQEVLWFENFNLHEIFTPVNAQRFGQLLRDANYPIEKTEFIEQGFSSGFSLGYEGPQEVKQYSANLRLRIGSKLELWNKVMKEVGENRYAGPFEEVPYDYFIQSPIGLVPKDGGKKTRLIFHLSHPRRGGGSVNGGIPKEICKVKYPEFDQAIKMCLDAGVNCFIGKSDMASAFRHAPLKISDFKWLILKAEHPISKKIYYFVEKCLPFGSSISCAHFQAISDAIAHLVTHHTCNRTLNYLDDYFFAAMLRLWCDKQIEIFIDICKEIRFPVSMEKNCLGLPTFGISWTFVGHKKANCVYTTREGDQSIGANIFLHG